MPSTRRALLGACAATFGLAAGCGESPDRDDPPTTRPEQRQRPAGVETSRLRFDGDRLVASADDGDDERPRTVFLIETAEERDALRYRSRPDGWRELRAFVDDTDLSETSLVIHQAAIGECYRRRIVAARRDDDGVDLGFCGQLRPAAVACDREAQVMEVTAVRLGFAVEDVGSYSVSSGGRCDFRITTEGDR